MRVLFADRRAEPLPKNPLDFCTIVNIFPREIQQDNHSLSPGVFTIPAGKYDKPGLLKVGSSSWYKDIDPDQPLIEIPVPSIVIAQSIVRDYSNGMPWFGPEQKPGLFYVIGDFDVKRPEHKALLDDARAKQIAWFKILVKQADNLWARTNGNSLAIADDMKLAARELNLMDKDWLKDQQTFEMVRCKACQTLVRNDTIVCPNCKIVLDAAAFAKLGLKFAS